MRPFALAAKGCRNPASAFWIGMFMLLSCAFAAAEQKASQGNLDVHYSAFNSLFLRPQIAKQHGLTRSPSIAILHISARTNHSPGNSASVPARIEGEMINLLSQRTALEFQEIQEPSAWYYLATFPFTDGEMLRFEFHVLADGKTIPLNFSQQFYRE